MKNILALDYSNQITYIFQEKNVMFQKYYSLYGITDSRAFKSLRLNDCNNIQVVCNLEVKTFFPLKKKQLMFCNQWMLH